SALGVSMYAALIVPEIVIAIASLLFFTTVGFPLGPYAIILTHAVFNTSVVLLICRARLASMERTLGAAAAAPGRDPRGGPRRPGPRVPRAVRPGDVAAAGARGPRRRLAGLHLLVRRRRAVDV